MTKVFQLIYRILFIYLLNLSNSTELCYGLIRCGSIGDDKNSSCSHSRCGFLGDQYHSTTIYSPSGGNVSINVFDFLKGYVANVITDIYHLTAVSYKCNPDHLVVHNYVYCVCRRVKAMLNKSVKLLGYDYKISVFSYFPN